MTTELRSACTRCGVACIRSIAVPEGASDRQQRSALRLLPIARCCACGRRATGSYGRFVWAAIASAVALFSLQMIAATTSGAPVHSLIDLVFVAGPSFLEAFVTVLVFGPPFCIGAVVALWLSISTMLRLRAADARVQVAQVGNG